MWKKVWNRQKRCEIANIKEFSIETYASHIYSCSAYVGGLCGEKNKWKRCVKNLRNRQKSCEIASLEEFSIENLCKSYILL